ncbi:hypothetical protein L228DRAFT_106577 [Xylona heveae TC161]|uniref:Uncharacterized protein n=1 Tax=Xylona heveae (strain CBS 132557 / TC161) TaxID=1328760 RepID=A0A165HAM8_XYLHT|nr:hypothetical protein L228DRAFT_106577 [Xylona heveae TC161]KZF23220.1 hypothetical protein L228DRAFT_106577 [Xylona heveae TC161]
MSSTPQGSSAGDQEGSGEKSSGINKYVQRMRTVLKRGKSKGSISSMAEVSGGSSATSTPAPTTTTKPKATPSKPAATNVQSTVSAAAKPVAQSTGPTTQPQKHRVAGARAVTQQEKAEKARALFAKYGLTLEPHEWMFAPVHEPIERVEKPVRMRVHRQCHRCMTTFGPDRVCLNCEHKRCKKCPRYPVKKTKDAQGRVIPGATTTAATATGAGVSGTAIRAKAKAQKQQLTLPSRTGGQDLVRKPIVQRVHRTCHRCSVKFTSGEKICNNCSHVRCKKCPRDPPKLHKYPDGYPGDAEPEPEPAPPKQRTFKKVRTRVRWYCHDCSTMYSESAKECSECGHERCQQCNRVPPKKIKPPPDPEVLRSLEARLAAMGFSGASEKED